MAIIGLISFILAIINGYFATIFFHKWAEGHEISRIGIDRKYIPSMNIIAAVSIFKVCDLVLTYRKVDWSAGFWSFVFVSPIF